MRPIDYLKVSAFAVFVAMFVLLLVALGANIGIAIEILWRDL